MSCAARAALSFAVGVAAVIAAVALPSGLLEIAAGAVAAAALAVFIRAVVRLAGEPGDERSPPGGA
jgi:hypothetical protein